MDLEEPETEKENNINSQNSAPGQERDDIANEDEMIDWIAITSIT